jgi:hypothetical protein
VLLRHRRGKAASAGQAGRRLALLGHRCGKAASAGREDKRLVLLRRRRGKAASAGREDKRLVLLRRRRGRAASAGRADKRLALRLRRGRAVARAHPDRGIAAASDLATSRLQPRSWYCRGLPARPSHRAGRHLGGEVERSHAKPVLPIARCHSCRESQTHCERRWRGASGSCNKLGRTTSAQGVPACKRRSGLKICPVRSKPAKRRATGHFG